MRNSQKTMALWAIFLVLGVLFFQMYQAQKHLTIQNFNYPKFVAALKAGEIKDVTFRDGEILGSVKAQYKSKFGGATKFQIVGNTGSNGYKLVVANGLVPNYERNDSSFMTSLFLNWPTLSAISGVIGSRFAVPRMPSVPNNLFLF